MKKITIRKKHFVFMILTLGLTLALAIASCGKHEHSYSQEITAPTCTEDGYTTYICECGESYIGDENNALGHNYIDGICSSCGAAEDDENEDNTGGYNTDNDNTGDESGDDENDSASSSHTHSYTAEVSAPTCTEGGYTTYTCECGETYVDEETDAIGHNYVEHICENCGYEQTSSEGLEYTLSDDGTYYIVSGIGACSDIDVIIPDTYNNLSVKEIGSSAFYQCSALTSIEIPDSVTNIGDYAFVGCERLVEVINKSSLNILAGSSDYGYVAYYALEVHSGESKIVNMNGYLFYTYDGVNYLIDYVGSDTELILPENYNGENYEINKFAFYNLDDIISVEIPASVTGIGSYAFSDCSSLSFNEYDNAYYLGNEENPYYALIKAKDDSTTSCGINENTKIIAGSAFRSCSSLMSVSFGDNNKLQTIGEYAFKNCFALTSIEIPASVSSIDYYAFNGCIRLAEVINKSSLDITKGTMDHGLVAYYALEVHNRESNVVNIDDYLFYTCDSINYLVGYVGSDTELILPESYNGENYEINKRAFEWDNITSVDIPDCVTKIGYFAFKDCHSLKSVSFGDNSLLQSIDYNAFADCYTLVSIEIPVNVTCIGDSAFLHCSALESVKFADTSGWYIYINGITLIDVTDPSANAEYLKSTYCSYYWHKK